MDFSQRIKDLSAKVAVERLGPEFLAQKAEREALERGVRVRELRSNWNAPKRHVQATPGRYGPWGEKLAALQGRLGQGVLVGLVGNRGAGKTQMGVELMKAATAAGRSALFRTAMELLMRFKASYRKDAEESELSILRAHRRPSLLVIDEIARRGETDWENGMLFELLNQRYADMTDTILTANQSPAEFESSIGPSLSSRMQEGGGIIECDWPSFRG
jgi:DNA replication protein DnaC